MELHLERMQYHKNGVNGRLSLNDHLLCYTIELPWRNNESGRSCIPEGKYRLEPHWSPRLKNHLIVQQVPNRSFILVHPANNALRQLKGCIAPVSELTGPGTGKDSIEAFVLVRDIVYRAVDAKEQVWIIISSPFKKTKL